MSIANLFTSHNIDFVVPLAFGSFHPNLPSANSTKSLIKLNLNPMEVKNAK